MIVRFTYLDFTDENINKAKAAYASRVAPVIRASQGNRDALFLEPAKTGERFISCTTWESEAELKAFESSAAYKQVMGLIRELAKEVEQQYYSAV